VLSNIIEITDFVREHNPAAAQRVRAAIYWTRRPKGL
jgi:hypothetical protein